MDSINCVEQRGVIEKISGGVARVNILSYSACASCQANGACGMSEVEEKHIDIAVAQDVFRKGETVNILMKKSLGLRATLLAYVLPFIIIIFVLIILRMFGINEGTSALVSIAALVLYFYILHLSKDKLNKTFQFTLNKVN